MNCGGETSQVLQCVGGGKELCPYALVKPVSNKSCPLIASAPALALALEWPAAGWGGGIVRTKLPRLDTCAILTCET